jgi:pyrroline-5-carboxylate reductase
MGPSEDSLGYRTQKPDADKNMVLLACHPHEITEVLASLEPGLDLCRRETRRGQNLKQLLDKF